MVLRNVFASPVPISGRLRLSLNGELPIVLYKSRGARPMTTIGAAAAFFRGNRNTIVARLGGRNKPGIIASLADKKN